MTRAQTENQPLTSTDIESMSDRELLEECVQNQRQILVVFTGIITAMRSNPVIATMLRANGIEI